MTEHRQPAVVASDHVWTLLKNLGRTREEGDEMLHEAHASMYHWLKAPELGAAIADEEDREHLVEALEALPR